MSAHVSTDSNATPQPNFISEHQLPLQSSHPVSLCMLVAVTGWLEFICQQASCIYKHLAVHLELNELQLFETRGLEMVVW